MREIESIHIGTLKSVLEVIIGDCKDSEPKEMAEFIVDKFLSGLGKAGKMGNKHGYLEHYSPHACLDFPYYIGRQVFILDG